MPLIHETSSNPAFEISVRLAEMTLPSAERAPDKEKQKEEEEQRQQEEMRQREQQTQMQQRLAELLRENQEIDRAPKQAQVNANFYRVAEEAPRGTDAEINLKSVNFDSESQQSIRDFFRERQILVHKLVNSLEKDLFEAVERSTDSATEKTGLNRVAADAKNLNQIPAELLPTSKDILNQRKFTELAFLLEDEVVKTNPELKKKVEMLLSEMEHLVEQSRDLKAERERTNAANSQIEHPEILSLDNYRFSMGRQGLSQEVSRAA